MCILLPWAVSETSSGSVFLYQITTAAFRDADVPLLKQPAAIAVGHAFDAPKGDPVPADWTVIRSMIR